ncbi:hypothetical protein MMC12_001023 [Toensbergia leucococca]|nr:hypothetical protein [Toensbergia leucococca]
MELLEPLIECDLHLNSPRLDELGVFDRKKPLPSEQFDHERGQLLTDGYSLGSKLQSRLKLVQFGRHTGGNGCLVLVSIDFTPKSSSGVLRFREATVKIEVGRGKGEEPQDSKKKVPFDKREPRIVAWEPHYAEGPAKTTLQKFNIAIEGDAIPIGPVSLGPNLGYSMSRERVKKRTIHGTLEGCLDRILEWKLEENNSAGDGIPPLCNFAIVVRWEDDASFYLRMNMRAVTVGGIPVIGRNTGAVYFTPDSCINSTIMDPVTAKALTSAISGGLVTTGNKLFVNADSSGQAATANVDLAKIDLVPITRVEEMLKKE